MRVPRGLPLLLCFVTRVAAAETRAAQRGQDGALFGRVLDSSGAALVGATVVATSPQLIGGPQTTVTDAEGRYRFHLLAPGEYALEASHHGFKTTRQGSIAVPPGLAITIDLRLALESLSETVSVVARPPVVDVGARRHRPASNAY